MVRACVLVSLLLVGGSAGQMETLARDGRIDSEAPVKDTSTATIQAPVDRVWMLLTDIAHWPQWETDVTRAEMTGPLAEGTSFTWVTGGTTIHSRIARVRVGEEIFWTGKAYQATAVHGWRLRRLADGRTEVTTEESMDGFMLRAFYSSEKLRQNHAAWLAKLKAAAER